MLEQCAMLLASPQRRSTQLQTGDAMDQKKTFLSPKLGWTLEELARGLSVSVPFLRLEVKRGRLRAAHLGRRVLLLGRDVERYLADASDRAA